MLDTDTILEQLPSWARALVLKYADTITTGARIKGVRTDCALAAFAADVQQAFSAYYDTVMAPTKVVDNRHRGSGV